MTEGKAGSNIVPMGAAGPEDSLPYTVELYGRSSQDAHKMIGRAATIMLARALFEAAKRDFPNERIALCRGSEILQDTG